MTSRNRTFSAILAVCLLALCLVVAFGSFLTERDISTFEERVAALGVQHPPQGLDAVKIEKLPSPVQRYFRYTFPNGSPRYSVVRLTASGQFRRPLSQNFNATTANQVIATGVPALVFSATTPIITGVWARAYDFFANGEMEMKAKILSTLTVVDEKQSPTLNEISLRRWLLESALYPTALLPGGPVTWEAMDDDNARAVVRWGSLRASMIAHFAPDGRMTRMQAETDGDLATPYHGSGEHVARSNYQLIGQQMIPMDFTISRMAGGNIYPFWQGHVDSIIFE